MIYEYSKFKSKKRTDVTKYKGGAIVIVQEFNNIGETIEKKHDVSETSLNQEIANIEKQILELNVRKDDINDLLADIAPTIIKEV